MVLFRARPVPSAGQAVPATEPGERIYAIGDVHGCTSLLRVLLEKIGDHQAERPPVRSTHIVLLGDLVDRGPDTMGTLDLVYPISQRTDRLIVLQGNHEQMMVAALTGESGNVRPWLRTGGEQTLRSFGVTASIERGEEAAAIAELARVVPRTWLNWLRALPLTARSGDYFFCHAGIRPGVPLRRQTAVDLMWIREEFLDDPRNHGAVIVHGHTPAPEPELRPNRINLDTGAYETGVLTALYLEGTEREIIQVDERDAVLDRNDV